MAYFSAADGARLFYLDEGDGLPLVCLPGLTRTTADFDYLKPHLPPVRLVRMDYRGRGKSDWTGAETYTVPQEAADVLALLDHLGIPSAAILGTSRGGIIGMYLCATTPDRVRGLCLNDVGPVLDPLGLERIKAYVGERPTARTYAAAAATLPYVMHGFRDVPPERWMSEARKFYIETSQGLEISYDPALRSAFLKALNDGPGDLWPLFERACGRPLALIRGANSDLLTAATAAEMVRRCPSMIWEDVPNRGHVPFLDEPESLSVIHRWLGMML